MTRNEALEKIKKWVWEKDDDFDPSDYEKILSFFEDELNMEFVKWSQWDQYGDLIPQVGWESESIKLEDINGHPCYLDQTKKYRTLNSKTYNKELKRKKSYDQK